MTTPPKKINLNIPISKMTKILYQNKKNNNLLQKQNLHLKTKINHLQTSQNPPQQTILYSKLKSKFQKLLCQHKQNDKLIKDMNSMIQQKNYQQLIVDVHGIQQKLKKMTERVLRQQKKNNKINKKVGKIIEKSKNGNVVNVHTQALFQLQLQKQKCLQVLRQREERQEFVEDSNKVLNREIIELLKIKNQLKYIQNNSRRQDNKKGKDRCVDKDKKEEGIIFHKNMKNKKIVIDEIEI